jgi:hypothetical protein
MSTIISGYYPGHYGRVGDPLVRPWIPQPENKFVRLPIISSTSDSVTAQDLSTQSGSSTVPDFGTLVEVVAGNGGSMTLDSLAAMDTSLGLAKSSSSDYAFEFDNTLGSVSAVLGDISLTMDTSKSVTNVSYTDFSLFFDSTLGLAKSSSSDYAFESDSSGWLVFPLVTDYSLAYDLTSSNVLANTFDLSYVSDLASLNSLISKTYDMVSAVDFALSEVSSTGADFVNVLDISGPVEAWADFFDYGFGGDSVWLPQIPSLYDFVTVSDTVWLGGILVGVYDFTLGSDTSSALSAVILPDLSVSLDMTQAVGASLVSDIAYGSDMSLSAASSIVSDSMAAYDANSIFSVIADTFDYLSSYDSLAIPGVPTLYDLVNSSDSVLTLGILTLVSDAGVSFDAASSYAFLAEGENVIGMDYGMAASEGLTSDSSIVTDYTFASLPVIALADYSQGLDAWMVSTAPFVSDFTTISDYSSIASVLSVALDPILLSDSALLNPVLIFESDSLTVSDNVTNPSQYILADFGLISDQTSIIGVLASAADASSISDFVTSSLLPVTTTDLSNVAETGVAGSFENAVSDTVSSSDAMSSMGFSNVTDSSSFMDVALSIIQSLIINDFSSLGDKVGLPPQYILFDWAAVNENAEVVGLVLQVNDIIAVSDIAGSPFTLTISDDIVHESDATAQTEIPVFTDFASMLDSESISNFTSALSNLPVNMTVGVPLYGKLTSHLVITIPGEPYVPPDYSGFLLDITLGPITTKPDVFGSGRIAEGAVVDVMPRGVDMDGIAIGNGIVTAVVGNTGKVGLKVPFGPQYHWTYRIWYPTGTMDPDKPVITIDEIPDN